MSGSVDSAPTPEEGAALLGRGRELRVLTALAAEGGGVALVHGPPGIGKSALLRAVAADARERGALVLTTAGVRSEAALPFAALERLLRGVLGRAQALPARQRDALLGGLGLGDTPVSDVFLIGLATLNLLAGDDERVLVIVDDAQWLDPASAEVLAFVARRIGDEPVALLLGRRDGPAGPLEPDGPIDVALAPLSDPDAAALVDRTGPPLPAAERRRLLALAAGNPLALVELPRAAGALSGAGDAILPLTDRLERAFSAQAAGLPPATRALLQVAAADDADFAAELLDAARVLAPDAGEPAVDAAVAARLLERDGPRLRFRHPLMRSALHQAASEPERRAAHAAVAAVTAQDPHRSAWHRAAATSGPDDEVARALDAAAADARRRGAVEAAARALERAAALSTDRRAAVARMLGAAELTAELGRMSAVATLVARAEALDPDRDGRARILALREAFAADGSADDAAVRRLVEEAAAARAGGDRALALRLLLAAGTRCWWALPAAAPVREEVVAETLQTARPQDEAHLLAILAAASAVRHAALVVERLDRACARDVADPLEAHLLGQAAHMVGHSELAVRQLARVEVRWRAEGRLALLGQALVMRAWSTVQLGGWPAVEPAAVEAERLTRETGQPLWTEGARAALAAVAGVRGETERATAIAAEVDAALVTERPTNLLTCLQVARAVTALGAGRYAEAYDEVARVFDPADPAHHYAERHGGLSYLAEAARHCGRVDEARAVLAAVDPAGGPAPATLLRVGAGVARPLLSDREHAEAAFADALTGTAARMPFHRGRLLLAQGAWLRRERRAADSRAPLRAARDLFDALGAVPWAERARHELRASGETSRRRAPDARDDLTPQERQIAQLAASGLSNPEIGERLFLSPRTVASHLYRAFPKLGIASRRELATVLGDGAT